MSSTTRFCGYPAAVIYDDLKDNDSKGEKPKQQLIWGDWMRLIPTQKRGQFFKVHSRGVDGWIHESGIQKDRLLEVTFVDVCQGDGTLLVTPSDKHIVIDAGAGDNMARLLKWRYGGFDNPWKFEAGIMSHPDQDHYGGFDHIFDIDNVTFGTMYHNGIMERKAASNSAILGSKTQFEGRSYLTQLIRTNNDLSTFFGNSSLWKSKEFPKMIKKGRDRGKFSSYKMLCSDDNGIPDMDPGGNLSIEILGPVVEKLPGNKSGLRWLGSPGKTKNGHSIVLKLIYNNVSVLLGGDLNEKSENFLLSHYTQLNVPPKNADEEFAIIQAARKTFQVDIAKCCHHGSSDFSIRFLQATNPIATIISSGDDEPHSHPRADALGSIGMYSRGIRPLVFSTELARSSKEMIKHPNILREELKELNKQIESTPAGPKKERLIKKRDKSLDEKITRSVAVYGAIHLRTDGHKVIIAQKLERKRSNRKKWDIYQLEPRGNGPLQYISKH